MSAEEISRLVKALSELGVCKIRLTGGEPTVRKYFFDILKFVYTFFHLSFLEHYHARAH